MPRTLQELLEWQEQLLVAAREMETAVIDMIMNWPLPETTCREVLS